MDNEAMAPVLTAMCGQGLTASLYIKYRLSMLEAIAVGNAVHITINQPAACASVEYENPHL
jgi:hypothetical protein